jgi:hypothetical protein
MFHDAREIVGEHVQGHFGRNFRQSFHQEVRRTHPRLERAEGMFGGARASPAGELLEAVATWFKRSRPVAADRRMPPNHSSSERKSHAFRQFPVSASPMLPPKAKLPSSPKLRCKSSFKFSRLNGGRDRD